MLDAEKRILVDEYDVDSWLVILEHALSVPIQFSHARETLDKFLTVFPTAALWLHTIHKITSPLP